MNGDTNGILSVDLINGVNGRAASEETHDENNIVFDDHDHVGFLLDKLNTLRKNKQFCDVILQVGNQQDVHEIYAHRSVLASASTYFLDIFTNDANSVNDTSKVQMYKLLSGNIDVAAFELIVEYIYTSRLEVPKEKVKAVYGLANRMKLGAVAHRCGQYLASTLTPETCLLVRAIPGVLSDPVLLSSVDSYIRQNIAEVVQSKYIEGLPKIQIEVLQNSDEERDSINKKHLFDMVLEWIKRAFDLERFTMDLITEKVYMLYYHRIEKSLRDCFDIEPGDQNYSETIQDYKTLARRLSAPKKSENGKDDSSGNHGCNKTPSKPRQFLFTRSDSESSLSSLADDDESDWKVLAIHSLPKYVIVGLVMVAGKLCHVSIKLRLHTANSPNGSRGESLERCDGYSVISPMNSARCGAGAGELDGKLLVCGGYDRAECLKTVEAYDTQTNRWTTIPSMHTPRGRFNIAVVNGSIYAIGGCDGQKELSSVEYFDPKVGSWKQLPNCPVVRSNAGVCALNNKIYVVGGWNGQRGLARCDIFDTETKEWSSGADLATGRYQTSVAAMNGDLYAVGGCDSWTCLNTVEKYSPTKNTWKFVAPLNVSRRGCGVTAFNGKLYAIGGHDGMHSLCSVEIYDPETNSWTAGPSLTSCRANVGVAVVDNKLFAVGGFNGKTFLHTIEYLDASNNEWTIFIPKESSDSDLSKDRKELDGNATRGSETCGISSDGNRHSFSKKCAGEPLIEVEGETG